MKRYGTLQPTLQSCMLEFGTPLPELDCYMYNSSPDIRFNVVFRLLAEPRLPPIMCLSLSIVLLLDHLPCVNLAAPVFAVSAAASRQRPRREYASVSFFR